MVLVLIIILIFIRIGLSLIVLSLDISFAVTDRLDSIRRSGEDAISDKVMHSEKIGNGYKLVSSSIMSTKRTAEGVMRVGLHTGKLALKATIKFFKFLLGLLIDALIALEGLIVILDVIIFIILVAISYFYMYYMGFFK